MHRNHLIEVLKLYEKRVKEHPEIFDLSYEEKTLKRFYTFIHENKDCFARTHQKGHLTSSALVLSSCQKKVLLTLHKKLACWLQLGGHADGCPNPEEVAMKEAKEESGLKALSFLESLHQTTSKEKVHIPFDLDIHLIPENPKEKAHYHFDLRYLIHTRGNDDISISSESEDLRWFSFQELKKLELDQSILRMLKKYKTLKISKLV